MIKSIAKTFGINKYKMVLIVRTDLRMNAGKIGSQCAHAAVDLYRQALNNQMIGLKQWSFLGQPKIVLKVNSENALLEIHKAAQMKNMNTSLVYDAGKTVVEEGTLTVLGIGPHEESEIDSLTKHLKLL